MVFAVRDIGRYLFGFVVLLAACGETIETNVADSSSEPATVRGPSISWDGVTVDDSGQRLIVAFSGGPEGTLLDPCNAAYQAETEEADQQVIVTVFVRQRVEPTVDADCNAASFDRRIGITLGQALGERLVVDGHDGSRHEPLTGDLAASPPAAVAEGVTTTTLAPEPGADLELEQWLGTARIQPWYDGFQFGGTGGGTVALNPDVDPPTLPEELSLQTITSRMGQPEWNEVRAERAEDLTDLGVFDLNYDPFADTLTIRVPEDLEPEREAFVINRVLFFLGFAFNGIETDVLSGFGVDEPLVDEFRTTESTRG